MAGQLVTTPDMEFAGFYYPEVLRDGLTFFRQVAASLGLTDEDAHEVHVQLLRAMAMHAHVANTRLDVVAGELLMGTATLLDSVKELLRLIGVETASAVPAVAPILFKLASPTSSDNADFIPPLAEVATDTTPSVVFEDLVGSALDRTDRVSKVYGLETEQSGSDGVVRTEAPDVFESATATVTSATLGKYVFIETPGNNVGAFRVVEIIQASGPAMVRTVRMSSRTRSPGFQAATALAWTIKAFTADFSAEANTNGLFFSPWATPVAGDMLFVGHDQVIPNQIDLVMQGGGMGAGILGIWEYYDKDWSKFYPTSVVDNGGTISFVLTSLLGTTRVSGAMVEVECLLTGVKEWMSSIWFGTNEGVTASTLGQTVVSTSVKDYRITAEWIPFEGQVDGTILGGSAFAQNGIVTMEEIPQNADRAWSAVEVNEETSFFLRYRIVVVVGPTAPSIDRIQIDGDEQYMVRTATQGETIGPVVLGSGDGSASQTFDLPNTPHLDSTDEVEMDEAGGGNWEVYARVLNFNASKANSRHYTVEVNAEGVAQIKFGDGVYGKVPTVGVDNVRGTQRVGGDTNGNVGAGVLAVNADGLAGVTSVTNPRSAAGWRMKDGATTTDLERVKRVKPADLRTRQRGINIDDIAGLAVREFVDADGTKPVTRAVAIEEGLGPKTAKLIVVGPGGLTLTADQKVDLELWFNGDRTTRPPTSGLLTMNNRVGVFNYQPLLITVVATVVWKNGNSAEIKAALLSLLMPLALELDQVTYVWDYEGEVSLSRLYATIHAVNPNIADVPTLTINGVAASLSLSGEQLPTSTSASILVNVTSS